MTTAFTVNEIFKAVKNMKNGKSTGIMKSMQNTSNMLQLPYTTALQKYSTQAKEGNPPAEIQIGILTPLPNPGKKKGLPENLRPIIL